MIGCVIGQGGKWLGGKSDGEGRRGSGCGREAGVTVMGRRFDDLRFVFL